MTDNDLFVDYSYGWDGLSQDQMLINMEKGWERSLHICGSGSVNEQAELTAQALRQVRSAYNIQSFANVGCGRLDWIAYHGLSEYVPDMRHYDLVPRHGRVRQFDCTKEILPQPYDLIMCRWVLNHLSVKQAADALRLFTESGSRYLLMTWKDVARKTNGKAVGVYWLEHGLILPPPLCRWAECYNWELRLWDLQSSEIDDAVSVAYSANLIGEHRNG